MGAMLTLISVIVTTPTLAAVQRASNPLRPLPWGKPIPVRFGVDPVTFTAISCASKGFCAAVGYWTNVSNDLPPASLGFIVDEVHGRWGSPFEVAGLDASEQWTVDAVACPAPGNCTAGGTAGGPFSDGASGFVVDEKNGAWGSAHFEPGAVNAVSCAASGDCAAVGEHDVASDTTAGFVDDEVSGIWQAAEDIPGLGSLSGGGFPSVADVVSCPADGECSAAGSWNDAQGQHGFVVDESHGIWGDAKAIAGISLLAPDPSGPGPSSLAISCAAPGHCSVIGTKGATPHVGDFIVDESGGTWSTAQAVPGLAPSFSGSVHAISCWAVGSCAAVGMLPDLKANSLGRGYVVEEHHGVWRDALAIPGLIALTGNGFFAEPTTISCDPTGDCAAGGIYGGGHNFVVDKVRGVWHDAAKIKGGGGESTVVSCVAGDHCAVATDVYPNGGQITPGPA